MSTKVVGIIETKRAFLAIAELAVDAVGLAKHGIGFGAIAKVVEILKDIKLVAEAAPHALPELADLDQAEAAELAQVAYQVVHSILQAIQG